MMKIDVFAHVLLPDFYEKMLRLDPNLLVKMPFLKNPVLTDMAQRRATMPAGTQQIISYVNVNPEDYLPAKSAALLVQKANEELLATVRNYPELFAGGVAMVAMNNVPEAVRTITELVPAHPELLGIQLFSRHLGKSWADPDFRPVFEAAAQHQVPIWLHPVFDSCKPDNNIIFSWEYEQTQAMLDLVQAGYFQDFPNLKVIVHHAGAMAPYFSGRIDHILPTAQAQDFRRFYVDTALLGNSKALELCVDFFGVDRVLFGTDAPLGLAPAGATELIATAIEAMPLSASDKQKIFSGNATTLFNLGDKR